MVYQFDTEIAKLYGVDEAIVIQNLIYWIEKNEANGKHFHDGRYWTYNSIEAFIKLFPFWSKWQIRRILLSLETKGVILVGNFNTSAYDHTQWYAFSDEFLQNYNIDIDKSQHRNDKTATSNNLLSNNTDNKPNNKTDSDCDSVGVSQNGITPKTGSSPRKSNSAPIEPAYNSPAFLMWWENLCKEPKWRYKSKQALTMAMNKLAKMSEQEAIVAMKKSIEMSWQGIFPPTERDMEESVRTRRQEGVYISDLMKNEKNRA
jgi:hypothetical protein